MSSSEFAFFGGFVMNHSQWFCETCYRQRLAVSSIIEHDGQRGACVGCNTRVICVPHQCNTTNTHQADFQRVLLQGIKAVCPTCSAVFNLAQDLESLPSAPDWLKSLAEVAATLSILIGGGLLLGAVLDVLLPSTKT